MAFRVTFLGTGGGRHTAMYQTRSCGGYLIEHDGRRLHVDPGPGALENMQRIRYDLCDTDSIIISHCHPDHYTDAACAIEGMTKGGWTKRGSLYGSVTVMEGQGKLGPALSPYHLGLPEHRATFRPGDVLDVDGMQVDICKAIHSDPTNVGFRMHTGHGIFSYVSDTSYTDEIADQYIGSRVVLLPTTTPHGNRINYHMCTDDAVLFAERVHPELIVLTHLGIVFLEHGPEEQARMVEEATGIRTVAGEDLMTLDMGDGIVLGRARTYDEPWIPDSAPRVDIDHRRTGRTPRSPTASRCRTSSPRMSDTPRGPARGWSRRRRTRSMRRPPRTSLPRGPRMRGGTCGRGRAPSASPAAHPRSRPMPRRRTRARSSLRPPHRTRMRRTGRTAGRTCPRSRPA